MSKVTINNETKTKAVTRGHDIPVGTYFLGRVGTYEAHALYVCAYDHTIVCVEEPSRVWTTGPTVRDYQPVDVDITVKTRCKP